MKEETILLCAECLTGHITNQFVGDEGWGVCEECGAVEQEYFELTYEELEEFECMDLNAKSKKLDILANDMITALKEMR